MAKKETNLKIGTQVYCVRKNVVDEKLPGGKIAVGRIKSYENRAGKVHPIVKEVGESRIVDPVLHYVYTELDTAVKAIDNKQRKC